MEPIKFRFKRIFDYSHPDTKGDIYDLIYMLDTQHADEEKIASALLNHYDLPKWGIFSTIKESVSVKEIKVNILRYTNIGAFTHKPYTCTFYSGYYTVIANDFRAIDENTIRTTCLDSENNIVILNFNLQADNQCTMEFV